MKKNNSKLVIITIIIFIVSLIFVFIKSPLMGLLVVLILILIQTYLKRSFIYSVIGNRKFASGDIEGMSAWYKKAISTKNSKLQTKIAYGYLLLKSGHVQEADNLLSEISTSKLPIKDVAQFKMTYSLVKWRLDNLTEAISLLEDVYNTYKCTTVYESLGYLLIIEGDYEKALQFNLEAREYNDSDNVIIDNLGETYYYLHQYDKALEIYEALVPKNPAFAEPYFYYGLLLVEKEDEAKALIMFEKALTFKESFLSNLNHKKIQSEIDKIKKPE